MTKIPSGSQSAPASSERSERSKSRSSSLHPPRVPDPESSPNYDGSGGGLASPAIVSFPNPALAKSVMSRTAKHVGEASGSRSRAKSRRRESRSTPALRLGSKHTTSTSVSMTKIPSGSQSAPASSARSERSKRRSSAVKADRIHEDEEEREATTNLGREEEQEISSTLSSPVREPYIPGAEEIYTLIKHPKLFSAFEPVKAKYREKKIRQMELPTLENFKHSTCLNTLLDPQLLPVSQPGTNAVRRAAKFIVKLSSAHGGEPLQCCSGFWVDWDKQTNTGTILTTAHLIHSKERTSANQWLCKENYVYDANVIVHLLDDTIVEGHMLYCQKHYNIALFRVRVQQPVQLPFFDEEVEWGKELFQLGRDESLNLKITYGRAAYWNPRVFERYHYIYFSRDIDFNKDYDNGGPVIDLNGRVVGMVNHSTRGSFIPSCILLKCLNLWKNFGCIPRPHLGLKFSAIKLLDPAHADKIWRNYNIEDGLIVKEVSEGSPAEEAGIRVGDVVECLNGEYISSTIELENTLLSISKGCLDEGDGLNAQVVVSIKVFHARKRLQRIRKWTVTLSDSGEFVSTATYPFASEEEISDLASFVQFDSGHGSERCLYENLED